MVKKYGSVFFKSVLAFESLEDEIIYMALVIFMVSLMLFIRLWISLALAMVYLLIFIGCGQDLLPQLVGEHLILFNGSHQLRVLGVYKLQQSGLERLIFLGSTSINLWPMAATKDTTISDRDNG